MEEKPTMTRKKHSNPWCAVLGNMLSLLQLPSFHLGLFMLDMFSPFPVPNVRAAVREKHRFLGKTYDIPEAVRCYGDYGCFSIREPWLSFDRPVSNFPQAFDQISPRLCLHTTDDSCYELKTADDLRSSPFQADHPVVFITHGYQAGADDPWIKNSVKSLLYLGNMNVITVDWSRGFGGNYEQAIANARLMGAVVAHQILLIQSIFNTSGDAFHLIGHNLGAHVMGYAGKGIKNKGGSIKRITGLDPARLYFEGGREEVRLHPSDASLVDVIYTDPIITKGNTDVVASGKLQFFAISPVKQGCHLSQGLPISSCTGKMAGDIFSQSILGDCVFQSYQCSSYENFRHSRCKSCGPKGSHCLAIGMNMSLELTTVDKPRKQFLFVGDSGSLCGETLQVVLVSKSAVEYQTLVNGYLDIKLRSADGLQTQYSTDITFTPGKLVDFVIPIPTNFQVNSASLQLNREVGLLDFLMTSSKEVSLSRVILQNLNTKQRWILCGYDALLSSHNPVEAKLERTCDTSANVDEEALRHVLDLNSHKFNLDAFVPITKRRPYFH